MKNRSNKLFVFGDSHSFFWDGTELPNTEKLYSDIIVYHLGPILAWNATEKALPEIRRILSESVDLPDYVFLSLGEIDVRTGRPHPEQCAYMVYSTAERIAEEFGTEVVIVTPPPPSDEGANDPEYPRVGELGRRAYRTERFTGAVETYAEDRRMGKSGKVSTILLTRLLNGQEGIFSDGVHLNRKALGILMECENKKFRRYFNNKVS